jgi:hypothetical protein
MQNITNTYDFNVQALTNGDISQLQNFVKSNGPKSLYIEWVPNELTRENAMSFFGIYGKIQDVDFVNKKQGNARMLFIHYYEFNNEPYTKCMTHCIANNYPQPFERQIQLYDINGNDYSYKTYNLRFRINLSPISRVEYNNAQLTDMVDRLRKELEEMKLQLAKMTVNNKML